MKIRPVYREIPANSVQPPKQATQAQIAAFLQSRADEIENEIHPDIINAIAPRYDVQEHVTDVVVDRLLDDLFPRG